MTTPSTDWVRVVRFDPGRVLDTILQAASGAMDEETQEQAAAGWAMAQASLGLPLDPRQDLIAHLGGTWTMYSDPVLGPNGIAIVSKLKDADATQTALNALTAWGNAKLDENGIPFQIAPLDLGDGLLIHALQLPLLAPALAVYDGRLFAAGSVQVLMAAVENAKPGTGSIVDQPAFTQTLAQAGVDGVDALPGGVMFADLKRTGVSTYQTATMLLNLAAPFAQKEGIDLRRLLPPLSSILKHLSPAVGHSYVDATGYQTWTLQPFPFATMASSDGMMSGGSMSTASFVGIVLPALGAARQAARKLQSSTNLRGDSPELFRVCHRQPRTIPRLPASLARQ